MPTFQQGDFVALSPAFAASFPGRYPVLGPAESGAADTYSVDVRGDGAGSDFHASHLTGA
jgi:hypothetical protein